MVDSFSAKSSLQVGNRQFKYFSLQALSDECDLARMPFSLKILLENLLRKEDGKTVTRDDILALCRWSAEGTAASQINYTPARVILQDFTGVPAVVDLAAMRTAVEQLGGDPATINPLGRVDLVIDHSVMVDYFGSADSMRKNIEKEFERNGERYQFLRWGQGAFDNFRVVPPGTGIVHQVNLEYLAEVVSTEERNGETYLIPDTLVGTDSHTTMINGLGVLGWGVGGIEAEAAMLGQAVSMVLPEVVGFELTGKLPAGTTATDLVLTVTQMLRQKGVVGKFVEFYGTGLSALPLADRATIANMAPEYGATCGIFPIDRETLRYLQLTGRSEEQIERVEAYARAQGMWRDDDSPAASYSDSLSLDLSTVVPSIAGPKRPQDRINLSAARASFQSVLQEHTGQATEQDNDAGQLVCWQDQEFMLNHGDVVIAAITSCTNTSNPAVLIAAGLLARNARARGLQVKPWVKTSFAPGSQVVPAYLKQAELMTSLEELGFNIVGFGCTTCIGNSGPLAEPISAAIRDGKLLVSSVLSGNRNFEGRIHQEVPTNYLASPPLVVAYALAGTMNFDMDRDPLGTDTNGEPVFLKDLWPSQQEVSDTIARSISAQLYRSKYADVFAGEPVWQSLPTPEGVLYSWPESTYIKQPSFFAEMTRELPPERPIVDARCLVMVGDSITTDHISPAGAIRADSPAGRYLINYGVEPLDFNSYGSRRGNHEVMVRGTFANVRLRNQLAPGTQGGFTTHFPSGDVLSIFDGSMRYQKEDVPLIVLAGKEYGTGSSRDWAAKGTSLLGIKAVIAESFERIHRSNLVGFGILPLQFMPGQTAESLGLKGDEYFDLPSTLGQPSELTVSARSADGKNAREFTVQVRIDTAVEWDYYRHGGILHYVLRQLAGAA